MNERIRQLAEQAVVSVDIVTGNEALDDELAKMYIPDCFSEKFAELIMQECVGVCESMQLIGPYKEVQDATLKDAVVQIKEHFGVE